MPPRSCIAAQYFNVADTPDFMKKLGLTGDRFTIKYGVISRHIGKDAVHDIPLDVWRQIPDALKRPFAITSYTER